MGNKQAFFKAIGKGVERALVPDLRSKILAALGLAGTGGAGIYGYSSGFDTGKTEGFTEGRKEALDEVRKRISDVLLGVNKVKGSVTKKASLTKEALLKTLATATGQALRKGGENLVTISGKGGKGLGSFVDDMLSRTGTAGHSVFPNIREWGGKLPSKLRISSKLDGSQLGPDLVLPTPTFSISPRSLTQRIKDLGNVEQKVQNTATRLPKGSTAAERTARKRIKDTLKNKKLTPAERRQALDARYADPNMLYRDVLSSVTSTMRSFPERYRREFGRDAVTALRNLKAGKLTQNDVQALYAADLIPTRLADRLAKLPSVAAERVAQPVSNAARQGGTATSAPMLPVLVGSRGATSGSAADAWRMASEGGARASQAGRGMRNVTPAGRKVKAPSKANNEPRIVDAEIVAPTGALAKIPGRASKYGDVLEAEIISPAAQAARKPGFGAGLALGGGLGVPLAGGAYWLGNDRGYDKGYNKGGNEALQAGLNFGHYLAQQQLAQNNDSFINRLGNLFSGNLSNLNVPDFSGLTFEDMLKMRDAQQ